MTGKWISLGLGTLLASLYVTNAAAQTSGGSDEIVITAELEEAKRQVGALTQAVTRRPRIDKPISRRNSAVCIGVMGMGTDFAHVLIDRVESNARSLDISVLGEGCQVNTLIVFTSNSRAQIEKLRKEEPQWFETLLDYEYRRVLRGTGAVQSWHSTQVKGADGKEFSVAMMGNPPREVAVNDPFLATRFAQQLRVDIEGSIIVFDNAHVPGKSIQQLADYATMRLFAPTDDVSEGKGVGMETILSLFERGAAAPDGLTPFDRAYLGALYSLPPTAKATEMLDATWSAYRKARYETPAS